MHFSEGVATEAEEVHAAPAGTPTRLRRELRPHSASESELRSHQAIYARGHTPLVIGGQLQEWNRRPLGESDTAPQLREIGQRFGARGVEQTLHGLQVTRGEAFARRTADEAGPLPGSGALPVGAQAAAAIQASPASGPLPEAAQARLASASGHDFSSVKIHDDPSAHRAAALLNARAFTLNQSIYFAAGEYRPTSPSGMRLLAHEAAHTVQQHHQPARAAAHARVSAGGDSDETAADHFADAVIDGHAAPALSPSSSLGRLQRVISFTHGNHRFITNNVAANETAAGFRLASPVPAMQWQADVTIHGAAGDPFGDWEAGWLQVEREFYVNVYWGDGANRTHLAIRPDAALPRRDASAAGNNFAHDAAPYLAAPFAAAGDVRSPTFSDTPNTRRFPWANPGAGRTSTTGWFNYGDAFVTYLSVRDRVGGGYRHLGNIYWNQSIGGSFDSTRAVGARISVTSAGVVNRSGVIEGVSTDFPPILTGNIANGHDTDTQT
jgi:hypothetical protein